MRPITALEKPVVGPRHKTHNHKWEEYCSPLKRELALAASIRRKNTGRNGNKP